MDEQYNHIQALYKADRPRLAALCYKTNNRFAYLQNTTGEIPESEMKLYNFTPTYDPWCLYCTNKNCKLKCSGCKFVYYCNSECQKKSWNIHKHHCKRDLFCLCISCGKENPQLKCDSCPVKYCSDKCKSQIEAAHKDFDCKTFSKTFNNK